MKAVESCFLRELNDHNWGASRERYHKPKKQTNKARHVKTLLSASKKAHDRISWRTEYIYIFFASFIFSHKYNMRYLCSIFSGIGKNGNSIAAQTTTSADGDWRVGWSREAGDIAVKERRIQKRAI